MARHYKTGNYHPVNKEKYKGKDMPTYRSSWEERVFVMCDYNPHVVEWSSESLRLPYSFGVDGAGRPNMHVYIPDLIMVVEDAQGRRKTYLIEVKPKSQSVRPPDPPVGKKLTAKAQRRHEEAMLIYVQNQCKWEAARKYCDQRNWIFKVFTESTIFGAM